jgi:hypothetical protein
MWPFLLMETVLSGLILWHGCHQYSGVADFIDRANEWEIAGGVMLSALFAYGLVQLLSKLSAAFRRRQRNRSRLTSQLKALDKAQPAVTFEPMTRIDEMEVVEQQRPRKSDARAKRPQTQQSQAQAWSRNTQDCCTQFA